MLHAYDSSGLVLREQRDGAGQNLIRCNIHPCTVDTLNNGRDPKHRPWVHLGARPQDHRRKLLAYHLSDVPRLLVAAAALLLVHVAHGATAGDQRGSIRARQDVI